jgi:hypothetical protein
MVLFGAYFGSLSLGKLPERIYWPVGFVAIATFIFLAIFQSKFILTLKRSNAIFLAVILAALGLINLNQQIDLIHGEQWWKNAQVNRSKGFERLLSYESDKPIVAFSSFYSPLFKTSGPMVASEDLPQIWNDLIVVGWVNRSPEYENNLASLGISQDLFTSIAMGDAYLAVGDLEDLQMVDQFLREHRKIAVDWPAAPFVFNDTGLGIWKVESFSYIK